MHLHLAAEEPYAKSHSVLHGAERSTGLPGRQVCRTRLVYVHSSPSAGWTGCGSSQRWLRAWQRESLLRAGPLFPSASVPLPVVLLPACLSLGRMSLFLGEAQVGGCLLNKALPPGNVFWDINQTHIERCPCPCPHSGAYELSNVQGHLRPWEADHQNKILTICHPKRCCQESSSRTIPHGHDFVSRLRLPVCPSSVALDPEADDPGTT